ncbi:MAG: beta-ketoacyl synthase N-terminal-like domain-containing protein [Bacteroidetes bacterium]|nr:beta-ketoacyl synthase N-terminal-like domain-containing protein [Bacteroidota bacterium]
MKIYITGIGDVSAIGLNAEENFNSLQAGISGIKKSAQHGIMLGEVALSNQEICELFKLPAYDYSRSTLLGLLAAKEAWKENTSIKEIKTGMISATSIGGLDKMEQYHFDSLNTASTTSRNKMVHDNGRSTEKIAETMGISGMIGTISTACSSGANSIMHGARLMKAKKLDRVLVGGIDPLAIFNIKGFGSLNILDPTHCKPFDDNRKGLNLGEGAAFLLLENEHSLSITKNEALCALTGWNNSTDAFHQTASSTTGIGATITMKKALEQANLSTSDIDYINAHGTGTGNNDLSESSAFINVFGDRMPAFSSTKSFTGHTLAAAGAIEAAYCVHSIIAQKRLPNLFYKTAMKETGLVPETEYSSARIRNVLTNSFGFGGNCSSLIFSQL